MAKVILDNIGNESLIQWFHDHWYYLPEALANDAPKGYIKEWARTTLELKLFLEARGFNVEINIKPKEVA